jgi:uncharacterized protein
MGAAPPVPTTPTAIDRSKVAPWWHTILFLVGMLGYGIWEWQERAALASGFARGRMTVYGLTIVFELFMLGYIWGLGLRFEKKGLRDVIGGKWASAGDVAIDVGIAIAFWIVVVMVLVVVQRSLGMHSGAIKPLKFMLPQSGMEMLVWVAMSATAGFCEETIFRGYLQRQFVSLTGNAWIAAVMQALVFGWVHLYQGAKSAISIAVYGTLFGVLAILCKSLRPGMIQHAGQDMMAGIVGSLLMKHKII